MRRTHALAGEQIPTRQRFAALRTHRGERIGRFGLSDQNARRWHLWEWLSRPWPDQPFYMEPDPTEPAPVDALSDRYPLAGAMRTLDRWEIRALLTAADRLYDVSRMDDPHRDLATLAVVGRTLHWLERGAGGAIELAPAWLAFRPRVSTIEGVRYTRAVVQSIHDERRSAEASDAIDSLIARDTSWAFNDATIAWPGMR